MLALSVRYLMGWAMATDPTDRSRPEWPPHPDRVFMALAAAYFEGGRPRAEREALTWLERQHPPSLWASAHAERSPATAFVPVNDSALPRTRPGQALSPDAARRALEVVPEHRPRQPRPFPVAVPRDPTMHLIWDADPPSGDTRRASRRSAAGSSGWAIPRRWRRRAWRGIPRAPNLVPREGSGRMRLRVPAPGRLEHLAEQHRRGGARSMRGGWDTGRRRTSRGRRPAASVFDSRMLLLRRTSGRELGLQSTLPLTASLRDALMALCPQPLPEWLSGHAPGGGPSRDPHLAFLPLARTTGPRGRRAAGSRAGRAPAGERRRAGGVPGPGDRARAGRLGPEDPPLRGAALRMGTPGGGARGSSRPLRSETWTRPSARWATVTPVAVRPSSEGTGAGSPGGADGGACVRADRPAASASRGRHRAHAACGRRACLDVRGARLATAPAHRHPESRPRARARVAQGTEHQS